MGVKKKRRKSKYPTLADRIIANSIMAIDSFYKDEPCWLWTGARNNAGYPTLTLRWQSGPRKGKVRTAYAHRMSIMAFTNRRLTHRMVARHLCNNSICVNPKHLSGGTQKQNVQQCVKEGRHFSPFKPQSAVA